MNAHPPIHSGLARRGRFRAFTLIELLLVLAVLVVLAAAALPMLTSEIDDRARLKEEEYLKAIGAAVESYTLRTRSIPSHTNFAAAIAPELGTTPTRLLQNDRKLPRLVLIDERLRIGTNSTSGLPFTQTVDGSLAPVSPRMMLISSVGKELPSTLASGVVSSNVFDALWTNSPNQIPSGWSWSGKGEDLKIQRIQMSDWFVQLALNAQGVPYGSYSLDNVSTNVMSGSPRSVWVLKGTRVALNAPDGTTQVVIVQKNSLAFVCDSGSWRSGGGAQAGWTSDSLVGSDLGQAATSFLAAPANPTAAATQTQFVNALNTYLAAYVNYANSGFANQTYATATASAQTNLLTTLDQLIQ